MPTDTSEKGLESLIMCGALDSFGERGIMLANIELLLEYHRSKKGSLSESLFADISGAPDLVLPAAKPATLADKLKWEKELLGLYVSGHPLDQYKEKLSKRSASILQLKTKAQPGVTTIAVGMVEDVRTILTRQGEQMAFIKLMDESSSIEAVFFPKSFAEYKNILKPEACIALKGRLSNRNGEISLVAEAIKAL